MEGVKQENGMIIFVGWHFQGKEKGKLNDNGLDNFSKISKEKLVEKVLFESSETVLAADH